MFIQFSINFWQSIEWISIIIECSNENFPILGFMGYSSYIYEIVTSSPLKDEDDDQLFYTKVYLDEDLRVSYYIFFLNIFLVGKKNHNLLNLYKLLCPNHPK